MIDWIMLLICSSVAFYFTIKDSIEIKDETIKIYLLQLCYFIISFFSLVISISGIYVELGG